MTRPFSIFVRGIPQPKGSKKAFIVRRKDTGMSRAVIVDDNKKTMRQWEGDVRRAVQETWEGPPLEGPVFLLLEFAFLRPQSAPKRQPLIWRDKGSDWDKVSRLAGDAMEGVVYRNDSQVALAVVSKRYSTEPGVRITVQALPQDEGVAVNATAILATLLWHCGAPAGVLHAS